MSSTYAGSASYYLNRMNSAHPEFNWFWHAQNMNFLSMITSFDEFAKDCLHHAYFMAADSVLDTDRDAWVDRIRLIAMRLDDIEGHDCHHWDLYEDILCFIEARP